MLTRFVQIADTLLLQETRGDPDETLTEAEFLVSVLKENGIGAPPLWATQIVPRCVVPAVISAHAVAVT